MSEIAIGVVSSVLGAGVLWLLARSRRTAQYLGSSFRLARRLDEEGISRFHFSRDDYGRTLRTYLSQAQHRIGVVSVSLRVTHTEGNFIELFEQRLIGKSDFRVAVSLLRPDSSAAKLAAESLDIRHTELKREITEMLNALLKLRDSLPDHAKGRLRILVHECFPMGSAILLDTSPKGGTIQVETKLFRAPRSESFGFEIRGPGPFYERNYRAWIRVLDESKDWARARQRKSPRAARNT